MDLTDAQSAFEEALKYPLEDQQARWLAHSCRRRPERLRKGGVHGHAVEYDSSTWPELPVGVGESITRGDIFDIADDPPLDVFMASYVFGTGRTGYGRSRYDDIRAGTPDLGDVLERVRGIGRCQGPVVAYAQLYGGHDSDQRTRPGTSPWSRVAGFGPAFFTKFLYFAVPGALILDARLARRVALLIGNEYGYLKNGRSLAWTPYRYAVYLHWMTQAATAVSTRTTPHVVSPELLELTLFGLELSDLPKRSGTSTVMIDVADPDDEGEAGD
jgi:hypothetical protein